MKAGGDISEKDRRQLEELSQMESIADADLSIPKERRAQMYVCMAHDHYQLDMDEEGNRLLLKAEDVCPGYFKGPVIKHQKENANFDLLINNLTKELVYLFMGTLRDK